MIRPQPIVTAIAGAVVVRKAVKEMLTTHRIETAKRRAIQLNYELNMQAIANARKVIEERIQNKHYRNPFDAVSDLNAEIDNQKIEIRKSL